MQRRVERQWLRGSPVRIRCHWRTFATEGSRSDGICALVGSDWEGRPEGRDAMCSMGVLICLCAYVWKGHYVCVEGDVVCGVEERGSAVWKLHCLMTT